MSSVQAVMMGAAGVGKTSLVNRFMFDKYSEVHRPTVEDYHQCKFGDNDSFLLQILDTTGSYEFPPMRRLAIQKGDIFLLVFAVDDIASFEQVVYRRNEILSIKPCAKIILVANKIDSLSSNILPRVLHEEIEMDRSAELITTSAKRNINVTELFRKCIPVEVQNELVLYSQLPPSKRRNRRHGESIPLSTVLDTHTQFQLRKNFSKRRPWTKPGCVIS